MNLLPLQAHNAPCHFITVITLDDGENVINVMIGVTSFHNYHTWEDCDIIQKEFAFISQCSHLDGKNGHQARPWLYIVSMAAWAEGGRWRTWLRKYFV